MAGDPTERSRALQILRMNADKPFVKRVLNRRASPEIENEDGTVSTHEMAWGEADGKYYVFPTIMMEGGELRRMEGDEAWNKAMEGGNFIEFDSPDTADWFSKNYKSIWGDPQQ